ncbi:related to SMI1 - beta-1,3-glucan synthesis protein [Pseudozyma flocculosa]|uniref:Related to SMI1 - beta-1,3-glucan synthesis protein n=1 Tax=Pseudozyma flocculosa TaxID=84751 RepID=A0A5C3EWL9_9BASI|nr:related to SMI1 - beta-1,3-glucan synthesis protein [Pseudozyma flocculosa]
MPGPSIFTQISSFFGGAQNQSPFGGQRKTSTFGSGLPSSSRRGPPASLNTNAWSQPYNGAYSQDSPTVLSPGAGQYPPPRSTSPYQMAAQSPSSFSTTSVGDFTNLHPSASSSTLVPPVNGRSARSGIGGGGGGASAARSATGVMIPSTAYPPLRHTWNRIRAWCDDHYEEIADTLNWPATEEALDELEMTIGFALPAAVRESYLCYDGQELESNQSCQDGLFFGLPLLSVEEIAEEWRFWRAVDEDPETGSNPHVRAKMSSCPHKWVRAEYSCRGWIPLITDRAGNYIGVDLAPHPSGGGAPGQVIIFGRDFDTKVVAWRGEGEGGWGRFLQSLAEELESGELWSLDEPSSGSDDEEDAIGYESYFAGGAGGGASRGGGDRTGEGVAGFRLAGEYKAWPVLEAWADKSIKHWESVGLAPGRPVGDDTMPRLRMVDENGEALDAEGSQRSRRGSSVMHADDEQPIIAAPHPLEEAAGSALDTGDTSSTQMLPDADAGAVGVNGDAGSDGGNITPTNSGRLLGKMLSPPLPQTRSSRKQKQRGEGWGAPQLGSPQLDQAQQQRRPFRPPPVPAQPLDLPTIDDVKAVHAAVLASDGRSHSVQFDDSAVPSGNRASYSNPGYRDVVGAGGRSAAAARRVDSLELDSRSSVERAASASSAAATGDAATMGGGHFGSGGRGRGGLGTDSSAEDSNSTFSGNLNDDPLRVGVGMTSGGVVEGRHSTSTAATSPRMSSEQREPLAVGLSDPTMAAAVDAVQGLKLQSSSDEVPALIGTHSLPGSPVKSTFGGATSAVINPSPLNPAVSGASHLPEANGTAVAAGAKCSTSIDSEVSLAMA